MPYAQQDRTPQQAERDLIILTEEYQIGYTEGWDAALAWAGIPKSPTLSAASPALPEKEK